MITQVPLAKIMRGKIYNERKIMKIPFFDWSSNLVLSFSFLF
jgi:hypothetical protein